MNFHLALLVLYGALLVALGVWIGRRVGSTRQFFVAGRSLGPGLLGATVLAANIGGGSTVGAAALGYRDGLAAAWWVGSVGIGTLLLGVSVGPRIWRIARDHDLLTVGDYLEHRYGSAVRLVATALLWVATLTILAAQLVGVAFVLEAVAGIPRLTGTVIGGVVMTVYFTAGGLVTSAWVNLVQLVVLWVGLGVAAPLAYRAVGGMDAVLATVPDRAAFLDPLLNGASGWHYALLLVPSFLISPGLLQKVYGARDESAVIRGLTAAGTLLLAFAALPPLLGMLARTIDPGLVGTNANLALPLVLAVAVPVAVGALGLAAVFSAEVSSADAVLFMLSTSLSKDLYRRFLRPNADDGQVLRVARMGALAGGALGTVLAIALGSVIQSLTIFYSLLNVSLFVPVIGGLYLRRPGSRAAMASIAAGVAGYLVMRFGLAPAASPVWSPNTVGLIASAAAYAILSGKRTPSRE